MHTRQVKDLPRISMAEPSRKGFSILNSPVASQTCRASRKSRRLSNTKKYERVKRIDAITNRLKPFANRFSRCSSPSYYYKACLQLVFIRRARAYHHLKITRLNHKLHLAIVKAEQVRRKREFKPSFFSRSQADALKSF